MYYTVCNHRLRRHVIFELCKWTSVLKMGFGNLVTLSLKSETYHTLCADTDLKWEACSIVWLFDKKTFFLIKYIFNFLQMGLSKILGRIRFKIRKPTIQIKFTINCLISLCLLYGFKQRQTPIQNLLFSTLFVSFWSSVIFKTAVCLFFNSDVCEEEYTPVICIRVCLYSIIYVDEVSKQ